MLITDLEYLLKLIKKADTLEREQVAFTRLVEKKAIESSEKRALLRVSMKAITDYCIREEGMAEGDFTIVEFNMFGASKKGPDALIELSNVVEASGGSIKKELISDYSEKLGSCIKAYSAYQSAIKKLDKVDIAIGEVEASFEVMGYIKMEKEIMKLSSTREAIDGMLLGGDAVVETEPSPIS